MRRILITMMASAGLWNLAHSAAPNFISAQTAPDGGIIIRWSSEADKIYRIDYAPELTTPMKWRELYTDYPSQGIQPTLWKTTDRYGKSSMRCDLFVLVGRDCYGVRRGTTRRLGPAVQERETQD